MSTSTGTNGRDGKRTSVRLSNGHAALLRAYFVALARMAPRAAERQAAALFCFPRRLRHRDVPALPAAARSRIIEVGSKRLAAWTWGAGPRVLLAHGWEGTARDMVPMASALARRGCRVTVFDMPAHGRSTGMTTTLPEMARAVAAVARATGMPDALVGHSLGAAAAVLAMRDELEASSAALIAPVSEPWLFLRRLADLLAFSAPRYDGLVARIEERAGIAVDAIDGVAAARTITARAIAVRAIILHDPADRQVPFAQAESLATAWRGAMLHAMPGLGHRRPLFDPEAIERVIDHIVPNGHAETNPEAFG